MARWKTSVEPNGVDAGAIEDLHGHGSRRDGFPVTPASGSLRAIFLNRFTIANFERLCTVNGFRFAPREIGQDSSDRAQTAFFGPTGTSAAIHALWGRGPRSGSAPASAATADSCGCYSPTLKTASAAIAASRKSAGTGWSASSLYATATFAAVRMQSGAPRLTVCPRHPLAYRRKPAHQPTRVRSVLRHDERSSLRSIAPVRPRISNFTAATC